MRRIALFVALSSCLFLFACGSIKTSTSVFYSMDTVITVSMYNVSDSNTYFKEIKDIYKNVNNVTDDYNSYEGIKNIYDLNNERSALLSDTLIDILKESINAYSDTNGYFNPFMGRLTHKWKEAIGNHLVLDNEVIEEELEIIRNTSLKIDGNFVTIIGNGNIDLGGIAKGYATKMAKDYLKKEGINSYYIDAGKSSISIGSKVGQVISVGLSHPFSYDKYIGIIKSKDLVISCSSLENQNVKIDDKTYHHLINPFSGYPAESFDSIFIFNDNPLLGDIYSTALFSMSLSDVIDFSLEKGFSILVYKDNSILYKSEGVELYE